jgi:hypothetical protein
LPQAWQDALHSRVCEFGGEGGLPWAGFESHAKSLKGHPEIYWCLADLVQGKWLSFLDCCVEQSHIVSGILAINKCELWPVGGEDEDCMDIVAVPACCYNSH